MRSRDIWLLATVLALAGVALLWSADRQDSTLLRALAFGLIIVPAGLATNLTARRRRRLGREDSPDSVERQASQAAAARSFHGALIVSGLLMLALLYAPGPLPALWAIGAFVALPLLFWVLYAVELGKLRG